jgi:hypothetical protein
MTDFKFSNLPPEELENFHFQHAPGKLSTVIDGESVVMDLQSGTYSSFNPVGSLIWNELQNKKKFLAILESILDSFEVDKAIARKELTDFLDYLSSKNFITVTTLNNQT